MEINNSKIDAIKWCAKIIEEKSAQYLAIISCMETVRKACDNNSFNDEIMFPEPLLHSLALLAMDIHEEIGQRTEQITECL